MPARRGIHTVDALHIHIHLLNTNEHCLSSLNFFISLAPRFAFVNIFYSSALNFSAAAICSAALSRRVSVILEPPVMRAISSKRARSSR